MLMGSTVNHPKDSNTVEQNCMGKEQVMKMRLLDSDASMHKL